VWRLIPARAQLPLVDGLSALFLVAVATAVALVRAAAYAFGTAGTDVYRHNLDAMASHARHAAELADEIRMTVRRRP
jgi:hypothetical protein